MNPFVILLGIGTAFAVFRSKDEPVDLPPNNIDDPAPSPFVKKRGKKKKK